MTSRLRPKTRRERLLRWCVRRLSELAMLVREEIDRADLDAKDLYRCTCGYVHIKGSKPCEDYAARGGSPRNIS